MNTSSPSSSALGAAVATTDMKLHPVTIRAIAIIKARHSQETNWRPSKHTRAFQAAGPTDKATGEAVWTRDETAGLAQILAQTGLSELEEQQKTCSNAADNAQSQYKNHAYTALIFGAVAALIAGTVLQFNLKPDDQSFGAIAAVIQFLLVVTALIYGIYLFFTKPHRKWGNERVEAEKLRLKIPEQVLMADLPSDVAGYADKARLTRALQVEYVHEFLAHNQHDWFAKKIRGYRGEVWARRVFRLVLVLALFAAASLLFAKFIFANFPVTVSLAPASVNSFVITASPFAQIAILVIGVLQTLVIARGGLSLAEGNRERYRDMIKELNKIEQELLPKARDAAVQVATAKSLRDVHQARAWWDRLSGELISEAVRWAAVMGEIARLSLRDIGDGGDG